MYISNNVYLPTYVSLKVCVCSNKRKPHIYMCICMHVVQRNDKKKIKTIDVFTSKERRWSKSERSVLTFCTLLNIYGNRQRDYLLEEFRS